MCDKSKNPCAIKVPVESQCAIIVWHLYCMPLVRYSVLKYVRIIQFKKYTISQPMACSMVILQNSFKSNVVWQWGMANFGFEHRSSWMGRLRNHILRLSMMISLATHAGMKSYSMYLGISHFWIRSWDVRLDFHERTIHGASLERFACSGISVCTATKPLRYLLWACRSTIQVGCRKIPGILVDSVQAYLRMYKCHNSVSPITKLSPIAACPSELHYVCTRFRIRDGNMCICMFA